MAFVFSNLYGDKIFPIQQRPGFAIQHLSRCIFNHLALWGLLIRTISHTPWHLHFQFCAAIRFCRTREGRGSRQTILFARGTRTIGMCSFDARSEGQSGNSLVRGGYDAERETGSPRWTRAVGDQQTPSLRDNQQAWREHFYRSMRAGEDRPGCPVGKGKGPGKDLEIGWCSWNAPGWSPPQTPGQEPNS